MFYQNYCKPQLLSIIQITADLQCNVLSKLLQTPIAKHDPNYCRQYYVLSKLLQTPGLSLIKITAHPNCYVLSKWLQAQILRII